MESKYLLTENEIDDAGADAVVQWLEEHEGCYSPRMVSQLINSDELKRLINKHIAEAQLAKYEKEAKPVWQREAVEGERRKILTEIEAAFALAPYDDGYLRIKIKNLYKAIQDGKWANAELGSREILDKIGGER